METKYKKRLLKLADFLEALPRKRFYFGAWVGADWKGAQDLSCGTKACALGWAATMPTFRRLGLCLVRAEYSGGYVGLKCTDGILRGSSSAAREVFGLDLSEFEQLFAPSALLSPWATPRQVAKNIRDFVEEKDNDERDA